MVPLLAVVVSAALMWAAFPPLDWGFLAVVAPAPFLWSLRRVEAAGIAIGLSFLWGALFFGAMLYYVQMVGIVAWLPLVAWLAASAALYGWLVWAFRLWSPTRWYLITIGGWALWELIRTHFPFGGFPWGVLGYAAAGNPGAIGSVQWIGASGWSVLSIAIAAGLVLFFEDRSQWRFVVDPAVVAVLLFLSGSLLAPSPDGPTINVAFVQGNSPCPGTHCVNENKRIYESHLELTRQLEAGSVDLVVWPENSLGSPYEPGGNPEVEAAIAEEARRLSAFLLVSGTRGLNEEEFLNFNAVYDSTGAKIGEYAKRHPVPFGEYVPWRGALDFIPQLDQVPRDMRRGEGPVVFQLPDGVLGSVISFEGGFPELLRDEVREGAEMMVVATNESTWGTSPASDQFLAMTRVNAAAIGQDLVHVAITGKSAFITAAGDVHEVTELLEADVRIAEMTFNTGAPTLYARFGDLLVYIAIFAGVAAIAIPGEDRPGVRRRDRVAQTPTR